jgi:hypothetical protein
MIYWLVNRIFWWTSLRKAIFDEVHLYDMIDERLKDKTPGSSFWNDGDGWKSWTYDQSKNKYYFNDIPENDLIESMSFSFKSVGPEFDLDKK